MITNVNANATATATADLPLLTADTIAAEVSRVMGIAEGNRVTMQTEAHRIAHYIMDSETPETAMREVFDAARKPYRAERARKTQAGKDAAAGIRKDWTALSNGGLRYHFGKAKLAEKWPNFASGDGALYLRDAKELAKEKREAKKIEEEQGKQLLIEKDAEQKELALNILRKKTPEQLAEMIVADVTAWQNDGSDTRRMLAMVADHFGLAITKKRVVKTTKRAANQRKTG